MGTLQKVTYPLLAKANDDPARLKRGYRKIIQVSSYVIFPAMVGMALAAEPLVLTLVGEQWLQTVPFLQILCVSGALYHLHSINLNVLKVVGRSDLFLKLEVIKKVNITIAIVIGIQFGIWGLLIGQVVSSYVALFINMYYTRGFIDYSIPEQLRDILRVLSLSIPMAACVWLAGVFGPRGGSIKNCCSWWVLALWFILPPELQQEPSRLGYHAYGGSTRFSMLSLCFGASIKNARNGR